MMSYPVRWILGLPIVALIWALAYQGERAAIASDLSQRAQAQLRAADLEWAQTSFNVTAARLDGAAHSEEERRRALEIVRSVWGVARVEDRTTLIPVTDRYIWRAWVAPEQVHLAGHVPDSRARRNILDRVRTQFPDHVIEDRMEPARGGPGPAVWLGGIQFGLSQLENLKQGGRVELDGNGMHLAGEAKTLLAYRSIKGDLGRRLPEGFILAQNKVEPPRVAPYTWQVIARDNQLEFTGHVPDAKMRAQLVEIAKNAFPRFAVVDKMVDASGTPEAWLTAVAIVLKNLSLLETGTATFSDQKVTVEGLAQKEVTVENIVTALRLGMPKSYEVIKKLTFREPSVPTVSPFKTTIVSDGTSVSLSGFVPDDAARKRLVAAVQGLFGERKILDALTVANGAATGWLTCVMAGAKGIARLETGRAEVEDRVLTLNGATGDEEAAAAVPGEVRAAANRACKEVVDIKVTAPPEPKMTWRATYNGSHVEISGEVLDSSLQAALVEETRKLFGSAEVVDLMRVTPGRSTKWPKVVRLALTLLARLREGEVRLEGQTLTVRGIAPDTAASTDMKTRLKHVVPAGYTGIATLEVKSDAMIWAEREARRKTAEAEKVARERQLAAERDRVLEEVQRRASEAAEQARQRQEALRRQAEEEDARRKAEEAARRAAEAQRNNQTGPGTTSQPAQPSPADVREETIKRCQSELNAVVEAGSIGFETGSDAITQDSERTLSLLINAWRGCPDLRVEIAGHTDSVGDEQDNLELSRRRAQAVADYIVAKGGLPVSSIVVRGYGETRPLVPNDTSRNRARNRRIEFNVLQD